MKKSLLIALLCVLMAFMAVSRDNEPAAKPEPEDKVLVDISKFTDDNYGVLTDGHYRGEADKRTVTDGKLDLASGGLGYYMGTVAEIELNGTKETYDVVVKADEKYEMTVVISNYEGLYIGGNAFGSKDAVVPSGDGLVKAEDSEESTTFVVTMEIKEGGVSYSIKAGDADAEVKDISYTAAEGEEFRYGFVFWATKGSVESIKIEKL